jgi:hypothetical protein
MVDRVIEVRGRGMRGEIGLKIQGSPLPGQFVAFGANPREVFPSAGTGTDAALRTDLAGPNGGGIVGVKQKGVVAISRPVRDVLSDDIRAKSAGVIGDGNPNPLSSKYATLAAARAEFPDVPIVALTDRMDGIALQQAIRYAETLAKPGTQGGYLTRAVVEIPEGRLTLTRPIRLPNSVKLRGKGSGATIFDAQNFTVDGPLIVNDVQGSVDFYLEGIGLHGGTHGVKIDSGANGQVNSLRMKDVAMRLQTDKNFEVNRLLQLADFTDCVFADAPYGFYAPAWTTNAVSFINCGFEEHAWCPFTMRSSEAVTIIGGRFEAGGNRSQAAFTGQIDGITLTVNSTFAGTIRPGGMLVSDGTTGAQVVKGTYIVRQLTTTTFEVSIAQTLASRTLLNRGVTFDLDRATPDNTGCQLTVQGGCYIENTNSILFRDSHSKNAVRFRDCHFTQALDNNGNSTDYTAFSDGIPEFQSNNMSEKSIVLPANVLVSGYHAKLIGNSNIYKSLVNGQVEFKTAKLAGLVGSPVVKAIDFTRPDFPTGWASTSGVLTVNLHGFDGVGGAVVDVSRSFNVFVSPQNNVLVAMFTANDYVGTKAGSAIDIAGRLDASASLVGLDILLGNLNGSTPSLVWWSFRETNGESEVADQFIKVRPS